jgi:hypothetical protein
LSPSEDVQKGYFVVVSRKIAFDYKHVANGEFLEKRLFRHPPYGNVVSSPLKVTVVID